MRFAANVPMTARGGDEPRQEDERPQHGGDKGQERQQVRELAEGLDILVQGDE